MARSLAACMREYVESLGFNLDIAVEIDPSIYANHEIEKMLEVIHQHLNHAGKIPPNSSAQLLTGPWQTFYAARQARYLPASRYHGQVNLVQVGDPSLNGEQDLERRHEDAAGWALWAEQLKTVAGPAQHFSVLKAPHVSELVQWWLQLVR